MGTAVAGRRHLGVRTLVQSLSSLQRVAGGCRHVLVARGERGSERGPAEKRSQQREEKKEFEKGANQHDPQEINTKVKLKEKQRQQREARAGMAHSARGGGNSRCKWTPALVLARPGVAVEGRLAE